MEMVALAGLVVDAQHAHSIHHVSQAVLQVVRATGHVARHPKHTHSDKSMIPLRVAIIQDQNGWHVVNHNNSDGCCKGIQQVAPGSNVGVPGLSVPMGMTKSGSPVGFALDGPKGSDRKLLTIGLTLEALFGPIPASK
jgi:hypothetical protein